MKTLSIRSIESLWDTPNFVRFRAHDVIYSYRQFASNSQQRPVSNLPTNNQQKLYSIRKLLISSKPAAAGQTKFNNKKQSLLISNQSPKNFLKLFLTNRVFSKFIFSCYTAADVYSLFGRVVNRNFSCDKTYRIVSFDKSSFRCASNEFHSVTLNMGWPSDYDQSEQSKVYEKKKCFVFCFFLISYFTFRMIFFR